MENQEKDTRIEGTEDQAAGGASGQGGKLFTQEEVNRIVQERLARVKAEPPADESQEREKRLDERELKLMAKEKLLDSGMPTGLADILRYDDEKSLEKALETIKNLNPEPKKAWGMRHTTRAGKDPIREAMGLDH